MSYTLVVNNKNLVGSGNNTYQYNFLQGNFNIPDGTEMMIANVQIPYSFYNITSAYGNNTLIFNWPTGSSTYASYTITIPNGFYTTTSLSNFLTQWMISKGFYLYNSTTAQNVYYLSLVYNTYQYGNQILLSPIPTSLPSGYSLPTGYTSSTIFNNNGFPSVSRTPYITLPQLSNSTSTLGNFLGFGSYSASVNIPALTGSGASISPIYTATPLSTSTTIINGGSGYINGSIINFTGGVYTTPASGLIIATAGIITAISMTNTGSYTVPPTGYTIVSVGSGAVIGYSLVATSISGLTISNGGSNYTNPSISFTGGGGSGAIANLIVSNGVITGYNLISGGSGFTSLTTISINLNGASYSGNSTITPVGSTVNSIIVRCSIVKNNVGSPNDILDSFPISAGTAFGTNINYTPNIEKYVKVSSGSFSNFILTFNDQNFNLLQALDNNILITILLKFPSK